MHQSKRPYRSTDWQQYGRPSISLQDSKAFSCHNSRRFEVAARVVGLRKPSLAESTQRTADWQNNGTTNKVIGTWKFHVLLEGFLVKKFGDVVRSVDNPMTRYIFCTDLTKAYSYSWMTHERSQTIAKERKYSEAETRLTALSNIVNHIGRVHSSFQSTQTLVLWEILYGSSRPTL